jgi:hypothetical protein
MEECELWIENSALIEIVLGMAQFRIIYAVWPHNALRANAVRF